MTHPGFSSHFFGFKDGTCSAAVPFMGDRSTAASGQDIRDRAFAFACRVVNFCDQLHRNGGVGRLMAPQLLNCSTSVAAMLEEARAAESRRDFVSKCCIALKECRESHVRLRISEACRVGEASDAGQLVAEANTLVSIISTIVLNTRRNSQG
jgi:four helix bundle protein